jgi:hypothetical protein
VLLVAACSGGSDVSQTSNASESSSVVHQRLHCGSSAAGSRRALRQFVAILRRGNELQIRSVLADPKRFAWLSVNSNWPRGPHLKAHRHHPGEAARAVAKRGGLPLRIRRFGNSEPPHRTTDFGFIGRWNRVPMEGKAAIDCIQGNAIVLSVGVNRRR